jgi:EAL domain-containing protein (putative c-di-GMP-specific phosphodiesterase class I)
VVPDTAGEEAEVTSRWRSPVLPSREPTAFGWAAAAALALLLGVVWAVAYVAGGTRTVLPHLFYVPIMLAGMRFGLRGGFVAAVVATLLSGPLLPLDVAAGEAQAAVNWLSRGVFFVTVGTLAGGMLQHLRRTYERELSEQLQREMQGAAISSAPVDAAARARIEEVLRTRPFHPVFQPIYSLRDGSLLAVEALTRFEPLPSRPPDLWFDEAARVGLGTELELAAVEVALAATQQLPDGVALTVNCSPELLCDPGFLTEIGRHAERRLVVEVTEHAVVEDYTRLGDALAILRSQGVLIAIDDAGAGFSSLQHVVRLAPDIIKLDISLTQHLRDDPVRRALADCLVRFAHETGCELIAEGIEHSNDLHTWSELGAHAAQGYLLGRPGPLPPSTASREIGALWTGRPLRQVNVGT